MQNSRGDRWSLGELGRRFRKSDLIEREVKRTGGRKQVRMTESVRGTKKGERVRMRDSMRDRERERKNGRGLSLAERKSVYD